MTHSYKAENGKCIIRPLKEEDIELLRNWRNNKELSKFLRPIQYITTEAEEKWFQNYLQEDNTYFYTVIDKSTGKRIGSLAIYNVDGTRAEVGKIVIGDDSAHGKGLGYSSLLLAMSIGFQKLHITDFRLDVHIENIAALSIYIKAGFEICGSHSFVKGGKELEMHVDKNRFEACNPHTGGIQITEL